MLLLHACNNFRWRSSWSGTIHKIARVNIHTVQIQLRYASMTCKSIKIIDIGSRKICICYACLICSLTAYCCCLNAQLNLIFWFKWKKKNFSTMFIYISMWWIQQKCYYSEHSIVHLMTNFVDMNSELFNAPQNICVHKWWGTETQTWTRTSEHTHMHTHGNFTHDISHIIMSDNVYCQ